MSPRTMPPEARERIQRLLDEAVVLADRQSERGTDLAYAIAAPVRRLAEDFRAGRDARPPGWNVTAAISHIGEEPGDGELAAKVYDAVELRERFE